MYMDVQTKFEFNSIGFDLFFFFLSVGAAGIEKSEQLELDTLYPRTSPFPFRSRWQTV